MTEELEKEAMDYANKWLEGVKDLELYHNKTDPKPKYIRIKEAYLAGAEPREKQIQIDAEKIRALQKQNGELTDKVKELEEKNIELENKLCNVANNLLENWCRNKEDYCPHLEKLEAQIEKLIDFVLSKTECCDVCPITDTCINSEGTCPYAGMLAKGEEEVTREWLMELISRR